MPAEIWLTTLFGGTIGSVIGLVGIYIAFRLTMRNDRSVASDDRTAASIAQFIVAANSLSHQYLSRRWWSLEGSLQQFVLAAQLFAAREARDHSAVTAWVLSESGKIADDLRGWQRHLPLFLRHKAIIRVARRMSSITGALVDWNAGQRTAEWFEQDLRAGSETAAAES